MLMRQYQEAMGTQAPQEGAGATQQGQEGSPTIDNEAGVEAGAIGPGNAPEPGTPGFSRPEAVPGGEEAA